MSEAEEVAAAAYAAFGRGDVAAILAMVADDADWESFGPPGIPYAGNRRGKEGALRFFEILGSTTQFSAFEPQHFVAQGDTVVAMGHERFTVTATGREADVRFAHVFTVRGGKIVRFREYSDTDAVRRAYADDDRT